MSPKRNAHQPLSPWFDQKAFLRGRGGGVYLVALYRAMRLRFGYGFESCDANGPRNVESTKTLRTHSRKRVEYGFGEYGFKHRTQWFLLALTEFWGESSMSSWQPLICVPKRTHRVFRRTHRVCRRTQWGSVSPFLWNSTLETVFRPFPTQACFLSPEGA